MSKPICIHPENPKIFEFRGRPVALVCATEHYGAVMNRPFAFEKYLADAAEKKQTLTRLFTLFRELQTDRNPYSTCKPETPDYIAPFQRIGPDRALDLGLKYDLSKPNPEFFDRLHRFVSLAGHYGVVVEVVLFSNVYIDRVWELNPLHPKNNVNDIAPLEWQDSMTLRHASLWKWQRAHIHKIVTELNGYDNVIYELCNEPGIGFPEKSGVPTMPEVDGWQRKITAEIRDIELTLPNRHLISGQQAMTTSPAIIQPSDESFGAFPVDIVNIHPLPGTEFSGVKYDMGMFMEKELKLRAIRDFALASYSRPKPLNYDEDNTATQHKDLEGWTIHRKRAWTAMMSGAHYDMIDFSIMPYLETGTPESQKHIRGWMRNLSEFVHSMDLVHGRPVARFLDKLPQHVIECTFDVKASDISIYLADERELGAGAGETIRGDIEMKLPAGNWQVACYSPVTGLYSPWMPIGGGRQGLTLPEFVHDMVVRIRRT